MAEDQYIEALWISRAVLLREPAFRLKSGGESYVYVNHRNMICEPRNLSLMAAEMGDVLAGAFEVDYALASVDSSVSPFLVAALALSGGRPFYNHRAVSRERGLADEVFSYSANAASEYPAGLPAVVVDDVVTTTTTLERTSAALAAADVETAGYGCLLDRRTATARTREATASVAAVATLDEVLRYGLREGLLDGAQNRLAALELAALDV